jgi:hypothetical protein
MDLCGANGHTVVVDILRLAMSRFAEGEALVAHAGAPHTDSRSKGLKSDQAE